MMNSNCLHDLSVPSFIDYSPETPYQIILEGKTE